MASRDYICDECAYSFRTPPSDMRDSPFVMCPACGSGFVSLAVDRGPRPSAARAAEPAKAGHRWVAVHRRKVS
jgi:DNA-directed RNA polymerase subunit RPC12/RpoP